MGPRETVAASPVSAVSHVRAGRFSLWVWAQSSNCHGHPLLTPSLPDAPSRGIGVHGLHRADERFLQVLLQLEVVEGLLEDGGLVHVCDMDGDTGLVLGGAAARVAEVDGRVRGLDGEAVLLDAFVVQGLWEGRGW